MFAELFRLLRRLWPISLFATLMGTASGVATGALLAVTNSALHSPDIDLASLALSFAGLCLLTVAGEVVSDIGNNIVGQRVIASLRKDLCAKILQAPLLQIEQLKSHRLITALNQDIDTLSAFSFLFSSLAIAIATLLGCLGYLLYLSPILLAITALAILLGAFIQSAARRLGLRRFARARALEDDLQQHYRAITDGAKELRLNHQRRAHLQEQQLANTINGIYRLRVRAANVFVSANAFGSVLFFLVIGIIVLTRQFWPGQIDGAVVSGFVLVLLYIKGPIQEIVSALPAIGRAQVALERLTELSARFEREASTALHGATPQPGYAAFERLNLIEACYCPPQAKDVPSRFELGPLSLEIRRGETVFIVGENGCGKTTLLKTLLGLYPLGAGALQIDGQPLEPARRDEYRQLFSAVFSDYYLFDTLLCGDNPHASVQQAQFYLHRLGLDHRVTLDHGRFSTTDLSTGQRKRLALVHAYLERRPVMVLDEWAADQDPTFRQVFYREILPDLKQQGTTLIVVSHDDRYFDCADRVIRLHEGKLAHDA